MITDEMIEDALVALHARSFISWEKQVEHGDDVGLAAARADMRRAINSALAALARVEDDALVAEIARAICDSAGEPVFGPSIEDGEQYRWQDFIDQASDALRVAAPVLMARGGKKTARQFWEASDDQLVKAMSWEIYVDRKGEEYCARYPDEWKHYENGVRAALAIANQVLVARGAAQMRERAAKACDFHIREPFGEDGHVLRDPRMEEIAAAIRALPIGE